jgi:4-hydroxybenzoate polyprenyltransferase
LYKPKGDTILRNVVEFDKVQRTIKGKKSPRLKEFITLFRLQTGATTALAPVVGYILAVLITYGTIDAIDFFDIAVLFTIGILIHIFLFVYNEYRDVDIDRLSPDLQEKPLVKGVIAKREALNVVIASMVIPFVLVLIFYFNYLTIILFILVYIFNATYDLIGKKLVGADIFIAIGIFLSVLFGASVVTGDFYRLIILTGLLGFLQIMFNNSVEGGLKDVDHDIIGGARTIALASGVRARDNRVRITGAFRSYAWMIKIIHILVLILLLSTPILLTELETHQFSFLIYGLLFFLILIIFVTMFRFLNMVEFDREKMKKIFSVHEISTYFLVPIALSPLLGLWITLALLLFPLFWYIILNVILYGQPLQPRV